MKAPAWDLDAWVASYVAEASSDANVEMFVQAVDSAILEQIPEIAENARLSEELHASTKSQWRSVLTVLERENPELLLPPQAVDIASA